MFRCIFCLLYAFVFCVSFLPMFRYSCLPSVSVLFYRPLPPGGNPVAVNKCHILSYHRMPDLLLQANTYYDLDMTECNFRLERCSLFVRRCEIYTA
jgi:hypothetical protein